MAQQSELQLLVSLKDEMSSGLMKIGGLIGGVFAVDKLINFGKESVAAAGEVARTQNQLNAVLASTHNVSGMTTKSINEMADGLEKVTNVDREAIISGSNMLLTFTHIGKDVFPKATEAMLNMATAMNGGLTPNADQLRGTAIQLGIALNDPATGIARLHRVGVEFSATQKEQIAHFIKGGEMAKAQGVILNELGTEFGNAARAATTPTQQMNRALEDVQKEIGLMLLPTVREYSAKIRDAAEKVIEFIKTHREAILTIGKYTAVAITAIATIMTMWKAYELITAAIKGFQLASVLASLPMIAFVAVAAAVAVGITYLSDKFGGLKNAFIAIGLAITTMGNIIAGGFKTIGNLIISFVNKSMEVGASMFNWFADKARKLGVDMKDISAFHIDFKFDAAKNAKNIQAAGSQLEGMAQKANETRQASAAAAKKAMADEAAAQEKLANMSGKLQQQMADDASKGHGKGKKAADDHTKSIKSLTDKYQELGKKAKNELNNLAESHAEKMKSIRESITKTQKSMDDLTLSFNKGNQDDNKNIAEKVVEQEKKVADLKTQIAQETDEAKRQSLQTELNKEQKALADNAGFIKNISTSIVEARRRAGLTELQRSIEDYQQKRELATQEYTEKMTALQNEMAANKLKEATEISLYAAKQEKIGAMMNEADKAYKEMSAAQFKFTKDQIDAEIKLYEGLENAIAKVQSAKNSAALSHISSPSAPKISGKRASGGPVSGGDSYLVGELGPEIFTPGNGGNITPNHAIGGQTTVINISGNTLLDNRSAEKIGNHLVKLLGLNTKFA